MNEHLPLVLQKWESLLTYINLLLDRLHNIKRVRTSNNNSSDSSGSVWRVLSAQVQALASSAKQLYLLSRSSNLGETRMHSSPFVTQEEIALRAALSQSLGVDFVF